MNYKEQFKDAVKKYWLHYIGVIGFALLLLYKGCSHANECRNPIIDRFEQTNISCFENQIEMSILNDFYTMNAEYDTCDTYTKKRDFHKKNAERCFNDAKQMCWLFPPKMREKTYYAFTNMGILASPGDPKSKLITCLVNTLIQYGTDAFEEWTNMNTKLHWAEYHWTMYEFYIGVVNAGNLMVN